MSNESVNIGGRLFRTETDIKLAKKDKILIDRLEDKYKFASTDELEELLSMIRNSEIKFYTLLGKDYEEEIEDRILNPEYYKEIKDAKLNPYALKMNKAKNENRRKIVLLSAVGFLVCFTILFIYTWQANKKDKEILAMKNEAVQMESSSSTEPESEEEIKVNITLEENVQKDVLDEYKNLKNTCSGLIGWLKIADIDSGKVFLDYPVMQSVDNEYYLSHDSFDKKDKNGSIFMDAACDAQKGNDNFILYGHHMNSGKMFGNLSKYEDVDFYKSHRIIDFDTIYEKGQYEVMYVFRSKVYGETEITFKYYQFIDANSETEFDSYMDSMEEISLIDTGVKAEYGDKLLTLSTCDYQEKNGRFVVVAKKISD